MLRRILLLFLGVAMLLAVQWAIEAVNRNRQPERIRLPGKDISDMPMRLGTWVGKNERLDPRVAPIFKNSQVVNRAYQNAAGGSLAMQVSLFTTNENELPHAPEVCYPKAGWSIVDQRQENISLPDQSPRPARMLILEQEGRRIHVLFWYQLGKAHLLDRAGLREEQRKFFGQKEWPPLIKVMLQSTLGKTDQAEKQLSNFAEVLSTWLNDLQ